MGSLGQPVPTQKQRSIHHRPISHPPNKDTHQLEDPKAQGAVNPQGNQNKNNKQEPNKHKEEKTYNIDQYSSHYLENAIPGCQSIRGCIRCMQGSDADYLLQHYPILSSYASQMLQKPSFKLQSTNQKLACMQSQNTSSAATEIGDPFFKKG